MYTGLRKKYSLVGFFYFSSEFSDLKEYQTLSDMYVPFEELPADSRIWIYQSEKAFSAAEEAMLQSQLEKFCETWQAHEQPLQASFRLLYHRFIVLAVNEKLNPASGCSIDKSVRLIQSLEEALEQSLTNRTLIVIETAEKELQSIRLQDIAGAIAENILTPETVVFNNVVPTIAALASDWKVPAGRTWLKRYWANASVVG